jgi:DNA-binding transcriptional regulator LsrR (DeoR family)
LDDDQLDRLLAAAISELKQRGKKLPVSNEPMRKQHTKEVAPPAFKAGVRPSRIAKQFGISQSDVRKLLASEKKK